ncbi:uncharacterized protein LOC62_05G006801 [Vanrija pseudolonga]|uniref:Uncharacterized protein n=1 Tax=Vanrija pseudolonga TaxID=143232 RepID=A0AAF0YG91_9TREE|nr:hypothetical protein LOC62_05G006801 [Vanrija pseudolonga]
MSPSSASPPAEAPRDVSPSPADPEDEGFEPSPDVVTAYEQLMASRLDAADLPPPPTAGQAQATPEADGDGDDDNAAAEAALGRPLTKAEKQNAKKKRRKERERQLRELAAAAAGEVRPPPPTDEDKPVSFRLFSTDAAPRPISLSTKEVVLPTPNPRLAPLTREVRERIARLAAEAALHAPAPPPASSGPPEDEYVAAATASLPAVFVARGSEKSAALAVPVLQLSLVGAEEEEEEAAAALRRKRRRVKVPRERPLPALWRPPPGLGGKSAGYAYGWGG